MNIEAVTDVRTALGEGPRWDAATGTLLWVDIEGCALHRYDGTSVETQRFDDRVGCATPTDDGDIIVALATRIVVASTGETLAAFPHGPEVRANDGACDPWGRLWVGTTALDFSPGAATLYRLDHGRLVPRLERLTISNGLAWSMDGRRMWFVDSPSHRIDEFAFDGELGRRRTFAIVDSSAGVPDGLAVDEEDHVWVAVWGAAAVHRYTPDGQLDRIVSLPAEHVSACCFGGEDGRTLFVTTAAPDGRLYAIDAGVSGPPTHAFRRAALLDGGQVADEELPSDE